MKILVDLSYVDKDNPTGVSVFALRLLHAILLPLHLETSLNE